MWANTLVYSPNDGLPFCLLASQCWLQSLALNFPQLDFFETPIAVFFLFSRGWSFMPIMWHSMKFSSLSFWKRDSHKHRRVPCSLHFSSPNPSPNHPMFRSTWACIYKSVEYLVFLVQHSSLCTISMHWTVWQWVTAGRDVKCCLCSRRKDIISRWTHREALCRILSKDDNHVYVVIQQEGLAPKWRCPLRIKW